MNPNDNYKKLIDSARGHQNIGELAAFIGICFLAILFLYAAYSTYRKGFQISKSRIITGAGAAVIAISFVGAALAMVIAGYFFLRPF